MNKLSAFRKIGFCVLGAMLVSGCASSAPVPRDHPPVPLDALDPAVDDVAQYLVTQLPAQDFVKASQHQLVFALSPTLDHDPNVPNDRVETAMVSLRAKLAENKAFTDNFVIVSSTEVQANNTLNSMQTDNSAFRDPLQRTADNTHAAKYDPTTVYLLSGRFYQLNDPAVGEREYKLFFSVDNPQSRTRVLQKEIDLRFKWDGDAGVWRRET